LSPHCTQTPTANIMEQAENYLTEKAIWEAAHQSLLVNPPRLWTFGANTISFGSDLYHIDEASLYELAMLDIHAQYWEATSPQYLRKYHRGLQYNVEQYFCDNKTVEMQHTPSFLKPWLARIIFMKLHNEKGRDEMSDILKDMSDTQRSTFQTGDFQVTGIISSFHAS
jgi:hypothetical protein